MSHFATQDQFRSSFGIDPSLTVDDSLGYGGNVYGTQPTGLLRPMPASEIGGSTLENIPMWIFSAPHNSQLFVYDYQGSLYTLNVYTNNMTSISDGGSLSGSNGNGAAYYDNYVYLAKKTTIARYGPLNGTASFDGQYWDTTLSKTALSDTLYYVDDRIFKEIPNHILHRHSDGKLYIADVVGNQGAIHYISTTKTTVEGDTDNGSTYEALKFGYKQWPTAICSYGDMLAIALYETGEGGDSVFTKASPAKIAFWDTTSARFNIITMDEFPDNIITALRNVNGTLYVVSGNTSSLGFRITQYVGGNSFKEVAYIDRGQVPFPGAAYASGDRFVFGSSTDTPESGGCVYSIGLGRPSVFGSGLFTIGRATSSDSDTVVTAISYDNTFPAGRPFIGWGNFSGGYGIDSTTNNSPRYNQAPSVWWSQLYNLGRPFKITKIRIPLAQAVTESMIVTPTVYVDDATTINTTSNTRGLQIINNTNYSGKKTIIFRPEGLTGENNFWLGLRWTGSGLCTVGLPITIEYELIDD